MKGNDQAVENRHAQHQAQHATRHNSHSTSADKTEPPTTLNRRPGHRRTDRANARCQLQYRRSIRQYHTKCRASNAARLFTMPTQHQISTIARTTEPTIYPTATTPTPNRAHHAGSNEKMPEIAATMPAQAPQYRHFIRHNRPLDIPPHPCYNYIDPIYWQLALISIRYTVRHTVCRADSRAAASTIENHSLLGMAIIKESFSIKNDSHLINARRANGVHGQNARASRQQLPNSIAFMRTHTLCLEHMFYAQPTTNTQRSTSTTNDTRRHNTRTPSYPLCPIRCVIGHRSGKESEHIGVDDDSETHKNDTEGRVKSP